jgi:deoxyribonuclease-1
MKMFSIFLVLVSTLAFAQSPYYPTTLQDQIEKHQLKDDALKAELLKLLSTGHKAVGYSPAKKFLFGQLHLKKNDKGYFVEDVYCKKEFTSGVGPGNIPDQNQVNCEHTWPQSKFTGGFPNETQKSDLHHLFPTDSHANSTRGNFDFAEVSANENLGTDCSTSKSGPSTVTGGKNFFEPPTDHKGNVARALFYFSVRYKIHIEDHEEEFLRRWNDLDPVDQEEINRNNAIEKIQGNRNPFIDFPTLASDIKNF